MHRKRAAAGVELGYTIHICYNVYSNIRNMVSFVCNLEVFFTFEITSYKRLNIRYKNKPASQNLSNVCFQISLCVFRLQTSQRCCTFTRVDRSDYIRLGLRRKDKRRASQEKVYTCHSIPSSVNRASTRRSPFIFPSLYLFIYTRPNLIEQLICRHRYNFLCFQSDRDDFCCCCCINKLFLQPFTLLLSIFL